VGLADLELPPNIHALLASRLDRLAPEERVVIEAASVVGLVFPDTAVRALVSEPVRAQVGAHLSALTLKHLVRPHESVDEVGEAFRFRHILIRDVVYQGILKRARATLHEQFVEWADRVNRDRDRATEFEEILGYHLEQAYGYLSDLGPIDEHGRALGDKGSERLASAGRRAFARGDMPAAANLLRRAVELLPPKDSRRLGFLPDLGEALVETGEFAWAEVYLDEALELAEEGNADIPKAKAALVRTLLRGYARPDAAASEAVVSTAEGAIDVFARAGDDGGLATAFRLLAWAHGTACRFGDAAAAAEQAMTHAARAGDERQRSRAACQYAIAALHGPTVVHDAIARCTEILDQAKGDRRTDGLITSLLAPLEAMNGNFDQARALTRRARKILDELGPSVLAASISQESAVVEMLAGDPITAEDDLRNDLERLAEMGETYLRSTIVGELARALFAQDRLDEAFEATLQAEKLSAEDDIGSQALWRSVRARILSRRGDFQGAIELAEEAIELLRPTDTLVRQADALVDLAEILASAGERGKAESTLDEALGLLDQKGNTIGAQRALATLAAFDSARAVSG
jgi:tetratricopeptide (TPR) repeat protein